MFPLYPNPSLHTSVPATRMEWDMAEESSAGSDGGGEPCAHGLLWTTLRAGWLSVYFLATYCIHAAATAAASGAVSAPAAAATAAAASPAAATAAPLQTAHSLATLMRRRWE